MIAINKLAVFKCFELTFTAICFGFHYKSQSFSFYSDALSITAYGGFLIITAGSLIGFLVEMPINRTIDTFFSLVGWLLFSAAGIIHIHFFQQFTESEWKHYGLSKGILSIISGFGFLVNTVASWRSGGY